ncbi:MAG: Uma2 family endonuclease [Planctomycetaceae bacterium]
MSTAELQTYTPEDLLHMPDGDRYELVDGQLVEIDMGGESSWVGGRIFKSLALYEGEHGGWAFPGDTSYQCFAFAPEMVRRPDASFVCAGRFEDGEIPKGHIPIPPDLAVEVVSPNDIYTRVEDKVEEYLQAGVRLVWVLNPANRTVRIFRESIEGSTQAGPDDDLSGGDVLPGFRCGIAGLFSGSEQTKE